ncbi:MAG TPA: TetR family transcriptional regulator, partial [Colwellia sp.]|nr:TetR family transcriptional regulator [Colwellia sp.]
SSDFIDFNDDELADIVSILRLINTFWVSFHQTQTIVNEVNDSVFYQGVLKILVILRPYTKIQAMSELNQARDVYQQKYQKKSETA